MDGGYVNNLPADVMRTMGARTVIAIDVSSANEKDFHNYGDYLNGFYAQFRAFLPWWKKEASRILTSQEIQVNRSAILQSGKDGIPDTGNTGFLVLHNGYQSPVFHEYRIPYFG